MGGGKWREVGNGALFVEGIINPPFFQTEIFPFSPYTTYQKVCQVSTLWAKLSQILISKCYNSAQKLWKTITKSYNSYAKYFKMFENFQGFFEKAS